MGGGAGGQAGAHAHSRAPAEVCDNGYPQNTAVDVLKMYINLGSVSAESKEESSKLTEAITGTIDWCVRGCGCACVGGWVCVWVCVRGWVCARH